MCLHPVYQEEVIPADRFELSTSFALDSMPMTNPFRGQMKVRLDYFFVPLRVYCPELRSNNVTYSYGDSQGAGADFKLPTVVIPRYDIMPIPDESSAISVGEYIARNAVHPGTLLENLRYPVGYTNTSEISKEGKSFNAVPLLGYWDIVRNYYVNPQEENLYIVSGSAGGTQEPYARFMSLSELNSKFINQEDFTSVANYFVGWDSRMNGQDEFNPFYCSAQVNCGGLALRTYLPDYYSNFIGQKAYQQVLANQSLITVEDGNVSVQQVTMATRLTRMAEDYLAGGGRISEYIRSTFCVRPDASLDIPQLIGSITTTFDFRNVSNTAGSASADPSIVNQRMQLGGQVARGGAYIKNKKLYFESGAEYGVILGIASVCPIPDYAGGTPKFLERRYFSDIYDPHMDRVGYEPLRLSQMYDGPYRDSNTINAINVLPQDVWKAEDQSVFYQPAFMEYLCHPNEVHGEFVSTLGSWTLLRNFSTSAGLNSASNIGNFWKQLTDGNIPSDKGISGTTYGLPSFQYYPFVDASRLAPNITGTFFFDVNVKRTKSKQISPVLEQFV